jgi:hypothetical protein
LIREIGLLLLVMAAGACSEAVAPQAAEATRVLPRARPDAWCSRRPTDADSAGSVSRAGCGAFTAGWIVRPSPDSTGSPADSAAEFDRRP